MNHLLQLATTLILISMAADAGCPCKTQNLNYKRHYKKRHTHAYKKQHSVTGDVTKRQHVDQNDFVNFLSLIKSLSFDELAQLSMHRPDAAETRNGVSRYDSTKVAQLLRMLPQSEAATGEGTLHGRELQDDDSKVKNHFYLSVSKFNGLLDTLLSTGNKALMTEDGKNTDTSNDLQNGAQNNSAPGTKLFFDTIERAINDSAARIKEQYVKVKGMTGENSADVSSPTPVENQDVGADDKKDKKGRKPLDFNKYDFGAIENVIKKLTSNESLKHLENTGIVPIDDNFKLSSTEFLMILKLLVSEGLGPHPANQNESESEKQPIERTSTSTAQAPDSQNETDDLFAETIKKDESRNGANNEPAKTDTPSDLAKSSQLIKDDRSKDIKKVVETLKDDHSAVTNKPMIEPITNEYLVEKLNHLKLHSPSLLPSKDKDLSTSSESKNAEDSYEAQYNQALIDKSSDNIKSLTTHAIKDYDEKYKVLTQKLKENEEKYNALKAAINSKEHEVKNENAALSSFLSDENSDAEKSTKAPTVLRKKVDDSKTSLFSNEKDESKGGREDTESKGDKEDKGGKTSTDPDKKPVGVKFEQFLKLLKNKDLSGNKEWKKNTYLHLSVSKFEDLFGYMMKKNKTSDPTAGSDMKHSEQKEESTDQNTKTLTEKLKKLKEEPEMDIKDETDQFQNLTHLRYFDNDVNEIEKGSKPKKGQHKKAEKFVEDLSTKDVKYQPETVGKFKKLLKLITFRNLIRDLPRGKKKYADYVKLNKDFIKQIDELLKLLAFNRIFDEKKVF